MFDPKLLRDAPDSLKKALQAKGMAMDLDHLIELDGRRRELTRQIDALNTQRNTASKQIGARIKAGENPEQAKAEVRALGERIDTLETQRREVSDEFQALALHVPNIPHPSTPPGTGEQDNQIIHHWGEKPTFDFTPRPHWDIGETLDILDLARGVKLSGSGFYVLKGAGAKLERALIDWFIDVHVSEYGYVEILPPVIVNTQAMTGTGQLPKLAEDMYKLEESDGWLIPTAEVPVTNLYAGEILEGKNLPIYHCAYSSCFRREAGSYGKDVRGIQRVHQFNKVELVKFVRPESSYEELESLRAQAQRLLEGLGLAYRASLLCSADLSFAAAKCYDLEVWAPGMERWLEVSSCSNFEDFQARRAGIRFRPDPKTKPHGGKPQFVHTLNGSALALPRAVIALLETYQQADGSVLVPEPLQPYLKTDRISC